MANVLVAESSLQAIADAIREKNGTEDTYTPAEMAEAIEAISGGGGITPTGTLEITQNGTFDVTNYASADVDVPSGGITPTGTISITENGTVDVTNYASANVNVPSSGFTPDDFVHKRISGEIVISGGKDTVASSFGGNTGITGITFTDGVTGVSSTTFDACTGITKITVKDAGRFWTGGTAFRNCTGLITVVGCYGPGAGASAFTGCTKLEKFDMPNLGVTNGLRSQSTFNGCTKLNVFVIRETSAVVELSNINIFNNTPFASDKAGGTLYVPSALISSYQSASNWSTILGYVNNSIKAIEGSIYENQYVDGTPILVAS